MRHAGYVYEIRIELELTRAEIERLRWLAELHYDWACVQLSVPGEGACLNGIWNGLPHDSSNPGDTARWAFTPRQLDTLMKVLERGEDAYDAAMFVTLGRVMRTAGVHFDQLRATEPATKPLLEKTEPAGKPGPVAWGVKVTGKPIGGPTYTSRDAAEAAAAKEQMSSEVHPIWLPPKRDGARG